MKNLSIFTLLLLNGFLFSQANKVGINTDKPQEILHVNGTMRFEPSDAANPPAVGKTLVSDANGNASWKTITIPTASVVQGTYATTGLTYNTVDSPNGSNYQYFQTRGLTDDYKYSGASITLPPGKWIVYMTFNTNFREKTGATTNTATTMPNTRGVWLRMSLSNNNSGTMGASADIQGTSKLISTEVLGPGENGLLNGRFYVINSGATNKNYYVIICTQLFATADSSSIYGVLLNFGTGPDQNPANRFFAVKLN